MTVLRNALIAAVVALAGLTACSSNKPATGTTSAPSLYDKWNQPLAGQLRTVDAACDQVLSTDCVKKLEALMAMLGSIRAEAEKASGTPGNAKVMTSVDKVEADYAKLKDEGCLSGNLSYACNTMIGAALSQDVSKVLDALAGTG